MTNFFDNYLTTYPIAFFISIPGSPEAPSSSLASTYN